MSTASPTPHTTTWPDGTSPYPVNSTTCPACRAIGGRALGCPTSPCPSWCALTGHPGKHDAGAEELDGRLVFYVTHETSFPVAVGRVHIDLIGAVTDHSDGVREAYVNVDAADVSMHSPGELRALARAAEQAAAWLESVR